MGEIEQMEVEIDALAQTLASTDAALKDARSERDTAVIRAEMAEAELAQLRQDARAALGRWHVAAVTGVAARLPGLDEDEAEALTESAARSADMDDHDLHRALRSVLGLADLPESDQT